MRWEARMACSGRFRKQGYRWHLGADEVSDLFYERLSKDLREMHVALTLRWHILWVKPVAPRRRR
jgi:hypothetical protein